MTDTTTPGVGDYNARAALSSGAMLRSAREAAGLTLDMVAQQLKLAPRQVIALEEGDYGSLPGRTFVRGFVRNYARLLHIDADHILSGLPGSDTDALHSPVLHPTAPTIGDLPTEERIKPGWTRWAIPVALVVVIASGVLYEFTRGRSENRTPPVATVTDTEQKNTVNLASGSAAPPTDSVPLPSPIAAPHSTPPTGAASTPGTAPTPLSPAATPAGRPAATTPPTPPSTATSSVAIGASALSAAAPGNPTPARLSTPTTTPVTTPAPATTTAPGRTPVVAVPSATPSPVVATPPAPPPATRPAPATATTTAPAPTPAPAPPPPKTTPLANPFSNPLSNPFTTSGPTATPAASPATPGTTTMVLTLRKASRTEVKDATGRMVLSETVPAGQTRTVTGTPPFDVVISNATDATLTYRGKQVDITPYTRQKVARFRLL